MPFLCRRRTKALIRVRNRQDIVNDVYDAENTHRLQNQLKTDIESVRSSQKTILSYIITASCQSLHDSIKARRSIAHKFLGDCAPSPNFMQQLVD